MSRRFAVLSVSAALLLSGALTACDNDDGGDPTPTETAAAASASVSASGPAEDEYVPASAEGPAKNVPKPTKPALADEESVEGAQAFLDYFSDVRSYAQQTGDTSLAREITAEECYSCMDLYDTIDDLYDAGGWASRGTEEFTVLSETLPVDSYGLYAPEASIDAEKLTFWDDQGNVIDQASAEDSSEERILVHMDYTQGKWVYITVAPLESQ